MSATARNLIVGIDLNRKQPQLCYYEKETDSTVTAPLKIGNETVSLEELFDRLENIADAEDVEQAYEDLGRKTAGIFRQAFSTLGLSEPDRQISGITVTVPALTKPIVKLIRRVYAELHLNQIPTYLQDYKESFYYHTLYQKKELWNRNVGLFTFEGRTVSFLSLSVNHMTRPVTVSAVEGITITLKDEPGQANSPVTGSRAKWDEQFYNMIDASLRQNIYSSLFIMGDSFDKAWAGKSISLLCKGGRKVFVVDNLYARGACYAAREKALNKQLGGYLYMGDDLIRNNLGMRMLIQGKETYYPLISAGVNWYEAEKYCECILEGSDDLEFILSDIDNAHQTLSVMRLEGLGVEKRPVGTVRLGIHITYDSPQKCIIEVDDLGFGDLFPAGNRIWREVLEG